ncbi:MAG: hypothetical protein D6681_14400 [Calditrichaeota bacterium]|nr:MAG: hypothetical protein D6681_14400 [Calditrichota bacterium]
MVALMCISAWAFGQTDSTAVPWDTVVAEMQIIESSRQPDSLKNTLMQDLFHRYHITAEAYEHFYQDFLRQPPAEQLRFLDRVKSILQAFLRQKQGFRQSPPPPTSKTPPKPSSPNPP